MESPEIDAHRCSQRTFDKGVGNTLWGKDNCKRQSISGAGNTGYVHVPKNAVGPLPCTIHRNQLKRDQRLNVRHETVKLLKKIEEKLIA